MKFWKNIGRFAAMVVLAITVASCEHVESPTDVVSSQEEFEGQPQELLGLDGLLGGLLGGGETTVRAIDQYGRIRTYTLLQEPLLTNLLGTVVNTVEGLLATVTELVGLNGGSLHLLGHRLVVPSGAVDQPTTFSLGVLLNGHTRVDLSAYGPGNSGNEDVGEAGFDRPVRLDMTYDRARVSRRNEDNLVILRLNPRGLGYLHEVMPTTVDERRDRATTWLEHFSGYAMAQ